MNCLREAGGCANEPGEIPQVKKILTGATLEPLSGMIVVYPTGAILQQPRQKVIPRGGTV